MMTLIEVDKLTRPIWDSGFLDTDFELSSILDKIKSLLPAGGYKYNNPLKLNQIEMLSPELEKAFLELRARYDALVAEQESLRANIDGKYES